MRSRDEVIRFLDASPELVEDARQFGVLRSEWTPSGALYFNDADVLAFASWIEEMRAQRTASNRIPVENASATAVYDDQRGHQVQIYLCGSCGLAIDVLGHCAVCSRHARGT
jgi:hypothetical protein